MDEQTTINTHKNSTTYDNNLLLLSLREWNIKNTQLRSNNNNEREWVKLEKTHQYRSKNVQQTEQTILGH